MTTAVDTVVPVARGQVRRWSHSRGAFLVLGVRGRSAGWRLLILSGTLRTEIIDYPESLIERWSTVVEP